MKTEQDVVKIAEGIKPQLRQILSVADREGVVFKIVLTADGWRLVIDDYLNDTEYNEHVFDHLAERKASTTYAMETHREVEVKPQVFDMREQEDYDGDYDEDGTIDDMEFLEYLAV